MHNYMNRLPVSVKKSPNLIFNYWIYVQLFHYANPQGSVQQSTEELAMLQCSGIVPFLHCRELQQWFMARKGLLLGKPQLNMVCESPFKDRKYFFCLYPGEINPLLTVLQALALSTLEKLLVSVLKTFIFSTRQVKAVSVASPTFS